MKILKILIGIHYQLQRIADSLQAIEERGRYYPLERTCDGKKYYLCDPEKNTVCEKDYCAPGCYTTHEEFALKR